MKKSTKRIMAFLLSLAMVLTMGGFAGNASAATKKVKLSAAKITLKEGKSKKITVKNAPKKAKITWKSNKKKIAKVNSKGKITAVKEGKAKITCTVKKGKKKIANLTVNVTVEAATKATEAPAATTAAPAPATAAPTPTPTLAPTPTQYPANVVSGSSLDSNLTEEHKSANGITTKDNGTMRTNLTSKQLIDEAMGQGWNLGNTLEAVPEKATTDVSKVEKAWNSPITTQEMIDGIQTYGVNTVRIPVAWSNIISNDGTYTINEDYLNRVEEVINYCLNNEMYAIVNIHWDGGWWGQFGSANEATRAEAWKRFESYWTQISNRYRDYSDHLIFESGNEELGDRLNDNLDANGNPYNANKSEGDPIPGVLTEDECYEVTRQINQKFVDIVRNSSGNNKYRHLLIAGYNTDIGMTSDARYIMPTDIEENGVSKLSVSVHYYTPSTYCISESVANSWGYLDTWGTEEDFQQLHDLFDSMTRFTDAGYGVMIGEYGVCNSSKDGIIEFTSEVMKYSKELGGFLPVLWDSGIWYDRTTCEMVFKDFAQMFVDFTGAQGVVPEDGPKTGIPFVPVVEDVDNAELVGTWTGQWTRTGKLADGSTAGAYTQDTCDENLAFTTNWAFWQLFFTTDWSAIERPAIRVSAAEDELSEFADLQLAYVATCNERGEGTGSWQNPSNYQCPYWDGKIIELDKTSLEQYPYVMISSNAVGASFVKVEVFDAAGCAAIEYPAE